MYQREDIDVINFTLMYTSPLHKYIDVNNKIYTVSCTSIVSSRIDYPIDDCRNLQYTVHYISFLHWIITNQACRNLHI